MVRFNVKGGDPRPTPNALKGKAPGKSKALKNLRKNTKKFMSNIRTRQKARTGFKTTKTFKAGKSIGEGTRNVAKGIGVKGALYITAGLTGVFVILRIRKEVNEWKPGDVFKAVTEDPITLIMVSIVIGIIVYMLFIRGKK